MYCLSFFLFKHGKGTSEICLYFDLSVIIVSWPLSINCTIYVLYLFGGFSCSYAVQSDLDCTVAHVTLIKCLLIVPGAVFLYHFMPIMIFKESAPRADSFIGSAFLRGPSPFLGADRWSRVEP